MNCSRQTDKHSQLHYALYNPHRPCWVLGQLEVGFVPDGAEQPGVEAHGLQHPRGQAPLHPPGLRVVLQRPHYQAQVVAGVLRVEAEAGGRGDAVLTGLDGHQLAGQHRRVDVD